MVSFFICPGLSSPSPQKGTERLSGAFALCLSGQPNPPPLFFMSSSGCLRLEVISQRSQKDQGRLSEIFALCLSPQGKHPPLFFLSSSGCLRLEVISQRSQKGQGRLSEIFALCLSPQGKHPPLFLVQFRRVDPRGHKSKSPKRHRTPFRSLCLMLVGSAQPSSTFLHTRKSCNVSAENSGRF